ncbi:MAG: hypothetical protein Q9218_003899 [Villophora microphyllina]
MAKASLASIAPSITILVLFSHNNPVHAEWRVYLKTIFVCAADDTYRFRYQPEEENRAACFQSWVKMPSLAKFVKLDLGPIEATPVVTGSPHDGGRRKRSTLIKSKSDDELEVSRSSHLHKDMRSNDIKVDHYQA